MISFLSVFPPYRGGIATFSDALYRELSQTASVSAFNFKQLYPSLLFPGTSQTIDKPSIHYKDKNFHPYNPLTWNKTAYRLLAEKPDVILYSYWHPFFAPAYRWVLNRCKNKSPDVSIICIAHNIMPHDPFPLKKTLTKRMLDVTDMTIVLSNQTEQEFLELQPQSTYKKLFHPIYELPAAENSSSILRNKYGFSEDDQIVLFMGLIRKYKGVDLLIEALNNIDLAEKNIKPMIVGEFYDDKDHILDKISAADRERYTVIDEFVPEKKMAEILSIADLLVLPYRKASQSGVLANAIYFNLPALVSDQPGLTEYIKPMKNGLIFQTGNEAELKAKIEQYFTENLKTTFSNNLDELKEELSWSKFAEQLLKETQKMG